MPYSYLWGIVHPERSIYASIGDNGNVIYVDSGKQIVAAVSPYFRSAVHDRIDFIESILLPTVTVIPLL